MIMESAELSTNDNAIGRGMDAHKKALFADHSDIDSGYVELSMSQSNATASTSGLSSSKFSSTLFKKSIDLETITENIEPETPTNLQETPTTRNIRHLNAIHIQTPKNETPKKANYFSHPYGSGSRNSSKKNRSQSNIRWSYDRLSPRNRSSSGQRKSLSRQTTFDSIDEHFEFNAEEGNPCDQSIGVSPIKPFNNSILAVKQIEKVVELQRHPSGIESSTPKNNLRRFRTQSIIKSKENADMPRNMRRFQSSSPAKRFPLSGRNFQNSFEPDDYEIETELRDDNPAQRLLDFTPTKFNKLFNQPIATATTNTIAAASTTSIASSIYIDTLENDGIKHLPPKRGSAYKNSRLVSEFTRKKSMKPLPNKAVRNLNECDLSMSFGTESVNDTEKCEDNAMNISNSEVFNVGTPSTNSKLDVMISNDTPVQNNCVKRNVCDGANRTPIKRFEKSSSYNFIQTKSSPEKEKFDIIYGHLPCTPPKKYPRRQLKRTLSIRDDSPQPAAPSAKRKLYSMTDYKRPSFYNGLEKVDILTHLYQFKLDNITGKILDHLPDTNLVAVHHVCKSWRKVLDEDRKNSVRRREVAKQMQMQKENIISAEESAKLVVNNNNNNKNRNVQPLHRHNPNSEIEERPTPVSPTTRRFKEQQSIISSLKPNQRVLHCPICNGTSIVYPETRTEVKSQRKSPRRQAYNTFSSQNRSLRTTKNKINNGLTKSVVSEYAVCSKLSCRFEFCTNCKCHRHNAACTRRPLGSSPKSDEDSPYKHEEIVTKRPLRPLRRLGRLVF